jgi:signal transduction histidine kinase
MKRLSLRTLAGLFFLAVLVASMATAAATLIVTRRAVAGFVDQRIASESEEIAEPGVPVTRRAAIGRIQDASRRRDSGDIGFLLVDGAGRVLAGNVTLSRSLPLGLSTLSVDDRIPGLTHGRALVRDIGSGMRLTTLAETEPIQNYRSARVRIIVGGFGSIILIVIAGILMLGRLISRRVGEMRHTVEAIIDGDMKSRVPVDGSGSELDQQALAFNRMLDRIQALMASISNVSHDIAHDLRTPLARLRANLALMHREADEPRLQEGLEAAIAESDQILELFTAILRIAEVEGGDRRAGFADFDLRDLLADAAAMMEPLVEEEGCTMRVEEMSPARVHGDRQLMMQAIVNLIENAIRYTPPGTRISVGLATSGASARLKVEDDGPGIPAGQRAEAMRRFGRLESARNLPGNGLGLPLVEGIARLHRGEMTLENAAPGLRVVITLPVSAG